MKVHGMQEHSWNAPEQSNVHQSMFISPHSKSFSRHSAMNLCYAKLLVNRCQLKSTKSNIFLKAYGHWNILTRILKYKLLFNRLSKVHRNSSLNPRWREEDTTFMETMLRKCYSQHKKIKINLRL
jgi:hypothetical protein